MKTDNQLQQDVLAELRWEPSINAARIGAQVTEGIVTLSGKVGSYSEKCEAEQAAQRVAGVRGLAVDIDVALAGSALRSDADIAHAAETVLQWTNYLPRDSVKVLVEHGWVTLSGIVDWDYQRQAAARAVRHLLGVIGVSDQIAIGEKVQLSAIKEEIEAALDRRARADARDIQVEVRGAEVVLSGTVRSWADRELARHTAWGSRGVRTVVDQMAVAF